MTLLRMNGRDTPLTNGVTRSLPTAIVAFYATPSASRAATTRAIPDRLMISTTGMACIGDSHHFRKFNDVTP